MFALGLLFIASIYLVAVIGIGFKIRRNAPSQLTYWSIVVLFPFWLVAGHKIYPSYFKFKYLCANEQRSVGGNVSRTDLTKESEKIWIVKNRLVKHQTKGWDSNGNLVIDYVSFWYYPHTTKPLPFAGGSGGTPTISCRELAGDA